MNQFIRKCSFRWRRF